MRPVPNLRWTVLLEIAKYLWEFSGSKVCLALSLFPFQRKLPRRWSSLGGNDLPKKRYFLTAYSNGRLSRAWSEVGCSHSHCSPRASSNASHCQAAYGQTRLDLRSKQAETKSYTIFFFYTKEVFLSATAFLRQRHLLTKKLCITCI